MKTTKTLASALLALALPFGLAACGEDAEETSAPAPSPAATGDVAADDEGRDDIGTFTVQCEVLEGDKAVGYVSGNSAQNHEKAEDIAEEFLSLFGPDAEIQECEPQDEYQSLGAYTLDHEPL